MPLITAFFVRVSYPGEVVMLAGLYPGGPVRRGRPGHAGYFPVRGLPRLAGCFPGRFVSGPRYSRRACHLLPDTLPAVYPHVYIRITVSIRSSIHMCTVDRRGSRWLTAQFSKIIPGNGHGNKARRGAAFLTVSSGTGSPVPLPG